MIDIETLKARLSIDDVLAYLDLEQPRRAGQARVIRCPFHADRTPSLKIFQDKQNPDHDTWYCFSCGKGGSIIELVRYVKNVEWQEAVDQLARLLGEDVVASSAPRQKRPEEILNEVADLAHADIAAVIRGSRDVSLIIHAFVDYDEILREYAAQEIDATEATRALLEWRARWKAELR